MTNATLRVDVGRMLCNQVEAMLESERFSGRKIEWIQSKGWISRLFTIRGAHDDVKAISERIERWREAMEKV